MIQNQQQYEFTKQQIQNFEATLNTLVNDAEARERNPLLFETHVSAIESQLEDLHEEIVEFELQLKR